jgi:hypothetical protein
VDSDLYRKYICKNNDSHRNYFCKNNMDAGVKHFDLNQTAADSGLVSPRRYSVLLSPGNIAGQLVICIEGISVRGVLRKHV